MVENHDVNNFMVRKGAENGGWNSVIEGLITCTKIIINSAQILSPLSVYGMEVNLRGLRTTTTTKKKKRRESSVFAENKNNATIKTNPETPATPPR